MANNTTKKSTAQSKGTAGRSTARSGSKSGGTGGSGSRGISSSGKAQARAKAAPVIEEEEEDGTGSSLFMGLFLLFLAFLFICNFGIMGVVGLSVKKVLFGLFGTISYLLPIVAAGIYLFGTFNRGNSAVTRRIAAVSVMCLLIMIGADMATGEINTARPIDIAGIYGRCSADFKGGGIIGGFIAYYLVRMLSNVGTILLIAVVLIICLMVIAGRSFLEGLREQGRLMYEDSREEHRSRSMDRAEKNKYRAELQREKIARKRELNEQREEERRLRAEAKENDAILRRDNLSVGVTFNTKLDSDVPVKELREEIRDDEHIIKLTDSDAYERKRNSSAVLHESMVSDGSDALREITPIYDEDDMGLGDYPEEDNRHESFGYPEPEPVPEPFEWPKEEDLADVQDEPQDEPGKPMDSYAPTEGNSMASHASKPRPRATREITPAAEAPKPVQTSKPAEEPVQAARADKSGRRPAGGTATYKFPPISLLNPGSSKSRSGGDRELKETSELLTRTLDTFGVKARIIDVSRGPSVTRYELQPELGVKVSKIVGLSDDLKLALAATDIRIEAPIPGKSAVGIEVPNKENEAVAFRELIESSVFKSSTASLPFAVGKDIAGQIIVHDIAKMPHVLIAGATGSGKSVCINTIIMSILYKCRPEDVRLIMVDPKVVELSVYNDIPHLLLPVVTDPKKAAGALAWAVHEMEERYARFADASVRDLKGYNAQLEDQSEKLPHILIIVDELADLMMVAPGEVEGSICRLAQLARACGIHLVIATQRPSVDVITGLIKANMPSRIAFAVSSGVDSRTILDMVGAEKLLGKGDMLFFPQGLPKPTRVQGAFVSDGEVSKVVRHFKELKDGGYVPGGTQNIEEQVGSIAQAGAGGTAKGGPAGGDSGHDELFAEAGRFIIDKEKASIGALQRLLKIGFNRAARIMDQLAEEGVVGEEQGTKPREILMDQAQFEELLQSLGMQ